MSRPAEILVTVIDEEGDRVVDSNLILEDSNQTSEVVGIEMSEDEANKFELEAGVKTNREWRLSVPAGASKHRRKSNPMIFSEPGRYHVHATLRGKGPGSSLVISSIVRTDGTDVSESCIRSDQAALRQ